MLVSLLSRLAWFRSTIAEMKVGTRLAVGSAGLSHSGGVGLHLRPDSHVGQNLRRRPQARNPGHGTRAERGHFATTSSASEWSDLTDDTPDHRRTGDGGRGAGKVGQALVLAARISDRAAAGGAGTWPRSKPREAASSCRRQTGATGFAASHRWDAIPRSATCWSRRTGPRCSTISIAVLPPQSGRAG